jgi:hypothetical protein
MQKPRLTLAWLSAPLVPALLFFFATWLVSGYVEQGPYHFEKLVQLTTGFALLSYAVSWTAGVLVFLVLRSVKRFAAADIVASSVLAGAIATMMIDLALNWENAHELKATMAGYAAAGAIWGLLVSAVFCSVAGIWGAGTRAR